MNIEIKQNLVNENKYNVKCPYPMQPIGITVHNTGNDASAENEIAYMIRNDNEVSFHFATDDKGAVQGLPLDRNGWHASDGNGTGNRKTIAIEICYSTSDNEELFQSAEDNGAKLCAELCKEYGWTIADIKRHMDYAPNKKYCPHRTMDLGWERFLSKVDNYIKGEQLETDESMPNTPEEVPSAPVEENSSIDVIYMVKTKDHGLLPEVRNLEDFAGWRESPITDIAIRVNTGTVKYRVHNLDGDWSPYVTGFDINDAVNGYAGNGSIIDAVEVYYNTPDHVIAACGYKKAVYRVAPCNGDYFDWQYDNETGNDQDGYAGRFSKPIGKLQIEIR